MKKYYIIISVSFLAGLFYSCYNQGNQKKYIIAFSQCTGDDIWRQTMLAEMKRELSFYPNVEFVYRDAEAKSDLQIKQIRELVKSHIDLLIVSPNEAKPLTPIIEQAFDFGIPVVVVDRRTNSEKYTAFVGASNFEVGQNAGRYAASLLNGTGNIIEMTGLPDASPVIDRHNGFMDIIDKYPGLHYVKKIDADSTPFLRIVERNLAENRKIDLIYAQNDFMARDAYQICKKLGIEKRIKIIGIDGLPAKDAGLDMVANKLISATVLYPTGGQESILTAIAILENKPFKKENMLVTTIIDSNNVRIMKSQSEKVISQQKDIEQRQTVIDRQNIITKNQSRIITIITLAFVAALILGGVALYYLRENRKINKRLEKQNIEISEQKNQLEDMSRKAEVAHQAKLNFFTNISHEFRTPLTLILSPLDDLLQQGKLQAANKQTLQLVQKNVMRLYRLVNQLMDFRKIEFGKMKLRASENDIVQFVREITNSYEVLANNKQISLKFLTSEKILVAWFDTMMIDKVIFNLLSNAFKFTKENGFIHVSVSKTDKYAEIKIEDNGIGMTQELITHAFEPFFQGEYDNYKGTGLGLALSKELIEIHHGNISVDSEKFKGTTFKVCLPLGCSHLDKTEMIKSSDQVKNILEDSKIYTTELFEKPPVQEDADLKKVQKNHSILVVEDNNDLRQYIVSRLAGSYDVLEAANANAALQVIFDNVPDLVILDVVIPGKTGLEITSMLKADVRTAHIPIILLTARSDDNQKVEGLMTGADAYVTKPFNFQFLEQTIQSLIHNREKTKLHYVSEVLVETKSQATKKNDRKFISEFSAVVENNISNDNLGVDMICNELNISRVQLYRKVKTLINCNVNDYIMNTRLQKAKYYLQHEDLSISEIAFKIGFSSATYFSTAFKSKFSLTPSEYKDNRQLHND